MFIFIKNKCQLLIYWLFFIFFIPPGYCYGITTLFPCNDIIDKVRAAERKTEFHAAEYELWVKKYRNELPSEIPVEASFSQQAAFYEALSQKSQLSFTSLAQILSTSPNSRRQLANLLKRITGNEFKFSLTPPFVLRGEKVNERAIADLARFFLRAHQFHSIASHSRIKGAASKFLRFVSSVSKSRAQSLEMQFYEQYLEQALKKGLVHMGEFPRSEEKAKWLAAIKKPFVIRIFSRLAFDPVHFLLKVLIWPRFRPYHQPASEEVFRAFETQGIDKAMTLYRKEVGVQHFANASLALARDGMKVAALITLGTFLINNHYLIVRSPELATLERDTQAILESRPIDIKRQSNFEGWYAGYTRRYGQPDPATKQFCEDMAETIAEGTDMGEVYRLVDSANIDIDKEFAREYLGAYKLYFFEIDL